MIVNEYHDWSIKSLELVIEHNHYVLNEFIIFVKNSGIHKNPEIIETINIEMC